MQFAVKNEEGRKAFFNQSSSTRCERNNAPWVAPLLVIHPRERWRGEANYPSWFLLRPLWCRSISSRLLPTTSSSSSWWRCCSLLPERWWCCCYCCIKRPTPPSPRWRWIDGVGNCEWVCKFAFIFSSCCRLNVLYVHWKQVQNRVFLTKGEGHLVKSNSLENPH